MTPEEHQAEHLRLHKQFDELLACYLSQRSEPLNSIHDPIYTLMQWSYRMSLQPQPSEHVASLIAQSDDLELLEWLNNADQRGGGFVSAIARAGLQADHENYPLIRPLLLLLRVKYPAYEATDAVKQELRDAAAVRKQSFGGGA